MPAREAGPRPALLALLLSLGLLVPTSLPSAIASQLDDLGTDDPYEIEGIHEAPWRAWDTTSVGPASLFIATDIATGPNDQAYITWEDGGVLRLAYPADDPTPGQQFHVTRVDKHGHADVGGVAIQENSRIWVVYWDNGDNDSHKEPYAATTTDPDDEWTRHRLADNGALTRIAIDEQGAVHVVYQNESSSDDTHKLHHATYTTEEGWTQETITSFDPSFAHDISVALEAGRLHVVWEESTFENEDPPQGYAVRNVNDPDDNWTVETVPGAGDYCDFWPDVGASPDGSAWISCRVVGVTYALHRTPDGTWSHEQVTDGSNLLPPRQPSKVGTFTSIAVDSDGTPHLLFRTEPPFGAEWDLTRPGQPQYAARTDGTWTVETIDRDGQNNGRYPSITVDSEDRPHAAYMMHRRVEKPPLVPCPGCGLVQETYELQHAQPMVSTAAGVGT